ncbi:MAG: sulfotransferase [Solirubrobacterales bacterium]
MPYSPTAGLPFDDEELESRLVWIWGSPRSGSTWLLRLLAHPLTVDDHAPLGFHQPPDSPQARLLPVNESFLTNHLAPLLQAHAADLVMSICRRSRLIFLVRDGHDVLDSLMHAIGPGGFLFGGRSAFQGSKERSEWVRRNSNNWVGDMKTIQRAYDAHPPELRRTVSYEALREDTAATLGPLAEWLGLRHDAGWLEDAIESNAFEGVPKRERGPTSFFRSARPGAWKQNLTRKDRRVAEEIMGEKLAELGYG